MGKRPGKEGNKMAHNQNQRNRRCGYCRQSGHTINNCTHESVLNLIREAKCAADFSIGFVIPGQIYMKKWIELRSLTQLRILRYQFSDEAVHNNNNNGATVRRTTRNKSELCAELFHNYYTNAFNPIVGGSPNVSQIRLDAQSRLSNEIVNRLTREYENWVETGVIHSPYIAIQGQLAQAEYQLRHMYMRRSTLMRRVNEVDRGITNVEQDMIRLERQLQEYRLDIQAEHQRKHNIKSILVADIGEWVGEDISDREGGEDGSADADAGAGASADASADASAVENECMCPICYESIESEHVIMTTCGHNYCMSCLSKYFDSLQNNVRMPCCAMCREPITELQFSNEDIMIHIREKYFVRNLRAMVTGNGGGDRQSVQDNVDVDVVERPEDEDEFIEEIVFAEGEIVETEVEWSVDRNPTIVI